MYKYQFTQNYNSKYKIKDKEVSCFSKSRMKDEYPDGNYKVIGETILNNKKEELDTIELGGRRLIVSKEDGHSKLFFKKVGYIREASGEYIVLLKRRWAVIWLLLALLLAELVALLFLFARPQKAPEPKITQYDTDTVFIMLPEGHVEYYMTNDISAFADSNMSLYMMHDGNRDFVHKQIVKLKEDGNFESGNLDFTKLSFELLAGDYKGEMVYDLKTGGTATIPVDILVRNSSSSSMTVGYSNQITINRKTDRILMRYEHGKDATHDVVLQVIVKKRNKEYLVGESGIVHAGEKVKKLMLNQTGKNMPAGNYKGYIRVFVVNGGQVTAKTGADIEVYFTIQ